LLVIFNNSVSVETIEQFLCDGGYRPAISGAPQVGVINWDIFSLYAESKKYDCLVIDAHTDSKKGIWNTTEGVVRANCFRDPQLIAVCYNSEEQKDKLQNTLLSREYNRIPLPAFLKCSDAHSAEKVGSTFSWARLKEVSFECLRSALLNPSEMISTEEPSVTRILNRLLALPNSFGIRDLSDDTNMQTLKNYVCALNNTDGGYILLGVTENKNRIGLPLAENTRASRESPLKLYKQIITCLNSVEPRQEPSHSRYLLQNDRVIISLHVQKGSTLASVKNDGRIYVIRDRKLTILEVTEIESLIQDRVLNRIQPRITQHLSSIENDSRQVKHLFTSIPILRSFEKNSIQAKFDYSAETPILLHSTFSTKLRNAASVSNGASKGNIFYAAEFFPPRLPDTYLRYSLPLFNIRTDLPKSPNREIIYLVAGGAVYYSNKDYPFFSEKVPAVVKLPNTKNNAPYGMAFTTCFLKSSFLLWYSKFKYETYDLLMRPVFENLRLPILPIRQEVCHQLLETINTCFSQILNLEKQYLIQHTRIPRKDRVKMTEQHNSAVDVIAFNIDRTIYKLLGISDFDVAAIEDYLKLNDIYIPKTTITKGISPT